MRLVVGSEFGWADGRVAGEEDEHCILGLGVG